MDEDAAWRSFAESGSVQDYLLYRQAKDCIRERYFGENGSEEKDEIQHGGTDTPVSGPQG